MRGVKVAVIVGALLWVPATAAAAERPVVTTGGVTALQPTTATVNGQVNPKGAATTYYFQLGTTALYGTDTPATPAGAGNRRVKATFGITGLAPDTLYHYRLVAVNSQGIARGEHRTFRTKKQPLGVTLTASSNPVRAGGVVTLSGVLSGTGNGGRQVTILGNPWPYTQGFLAVTNTLVTNADGSFSATLPSVAVNTQYMVQMPAKPEVISPVLALGTTVNVTRNVSVNRGDRSGRVRFSGRVTPAVDGREVLIQKLRRSDGVWYRVGRTVTRFSGGDSSRYRITIKQRKPGRYRVLVNMNDKYSPSSSSSFKVNRVRD